MDKLQKALRKPFTSILISIVLGFLFGAIILAVAGYNPIEAYSALIKGIFSRPKYIAQVIIKSTPLILTGLSVAFAFKTGLFNIGAEGQFIIGSMTAVLVGYFIPMPKPLHFFAVIILAMIFAGLWGGICGFLKSKFGIHEVITSIMLNWIALYFNNYMVMTPLLKRPNSESSHEIAQSAWSMVLGEWKKSPEGLDYLSNHSTLSEVLLKTDLNYGIIVAVIAVFIVWFFLNRTTKGYELRAVGFNQHASEFAGINVKKNLIISMFVAGAICGLAGALQVTGVMPHRISILAAHEGFGFDGISVALIANSSPIGCIFAGLLFGALKFGSSSIQTAVGAPSEIINIVIGTIVLFIAMSPLFTILADKIAKKQKGSAKNAK